MGEPTQGLLDVLSENVDSRGQRTIDEWEMVSITNNTDREVNFQYANRPYRVKPGHTRVIPYYAMVLYCGDPRAFDVPGDERRKFRSDEFRRLRTLWGIYDDASLLSNLPDFTVESLAGNRIITVLNDPDGNADELQALEDNELERTKAEMRALAAKHEALMARIDDLERANMSNPTHIESLQISDLDELRRTDTPAVVPTDDTEPFPVGPKEAPSLVKNIKPSKSV